MGNKDTQNSIISENKGRGLFYAVIAVATFIIMAVGATFAYFTATTNSMNSAVQTGSTTLQLQYISYGSAWMRNDLIPANDVVVEYSFENQNDTTLRTEPVVEGQTVAKDANLLCKDDYGNSICSVYSFQVTNSSNSPQSVSLDVVSEENSFASLNAMAYEISLPEDLTDYNSKDNNNGKNDPVFKKNAEDTTENAIIVYDAKENPLTEDDYNEIYLNRKGVVKKLLKFVESTDQAAGTQVIKPAINRLVVPITEENQFGGDELKTVRVADSIEITGGETKTFALVLYILNDETKDQTESDAEKKFAGRVVISSDDGSGGVSGSISMLTEDAEKELQSKQ